MRKMLLILLILALVPTQVTFAASPKPTPTKISARTAYELVYLVELEKLARDIYNYLYLHNKKLVKYKEIAISEQEHMNMVRVALKAKGIKDQSTKLKPGQYSFRTLTEYYNRFISHYDPKIPYSVGVEVEAEDMNAIDSVKIVVVEKDVLQLLNTLEAQSNLHLKYFNK